MGRPGRPAELRDAKFVGVLMEESVLRRIEELGVERSAFIRGAVEMALGADSLTEVLKEKERLRSEVRELRREVAEKDRRIRELEREVERSMRRIAELEEKLARKEEKIEEMREEANEKRYRTSFGWLTVGEIKMLYEKKKNKLTNPHGWLSSVLLDNSLAIQEVAPLLGLQDSSSSMSSDAKSADVASTAEDAAVRENAVDLKEKERMERMLRAREVRRRRRLMMEMDFKALAEELGCSEEEARRIVAEKFASSQASSESSGEDAEEEESSELIKKARSIIEGY